MSTAADGALVRAVLTLARAGIDFVVVGVQGINFYARDAADVVTTADVDVFGANVIAVDAAGTTVDVMLSAVGLDFADLRSDASTFRIDGTEIRVGRLEKLLRSKELAGRPKDIAFLRMFAARLREEAGD